MVMNKMSSMNGQFNGNDFNNDTYNLNGKSHAFDGNDAQRIEQYKASLLFFFLFFRSGCT